MQEDTCSFHPMKTHRNSMGRVDICKNPVVNSWFLRKLPGPFCTSRAAVCGCFLDVHIREAKCWRNFWKKKSSNMFFFHGNFFRILFFGEFFTDCTMENHHQTRIWANMFQTFSKRTRQCHFCQRPLFPDRSGIGVWVWAS